MAPLTKSECLFHNAIFRFKCASWYTFRNVYHEAPVSCWTVLDCAGMCWNALECFVYHEAPVSWWNVHLFRGTHSTCFVVHIRMCFVVHTGMYTTSPPPQESVGGGLLNVGVCFSNKSCMRPQSPTSGKFRFVTWRRYVFFLRSPPPFDYGVPDQTMESLLKLPGVDQYHVIISQAHPQSSLLLLD